MLDVALDVICSSRRLCHASTLRGMCKCWCFREHLQISLDCFFPSFPLVGTIDVGKTRLMFWDLGGQEELQSLWDKVGDVFFL